MTDEMEKLLKEKKELEDQVKIAKMEYDMEQEALDRKHDVFKELTNREVVELLGEPAYQVKEDDFIPLEYDDPNLAPVFNEYIKKHFRVDLNETS